MPAKLLMLQGSSSSVGKSLLVAALCRIYARRGIKVAPFKAQNMSNNAAVCADSSEIGRAQALQALAAGVAPTVDMNPVLIKPEADSRSQIILMGRAWQTLDAKDYYDEINGTRTRADASRTDDSKKNQRPSAFISVPSKTVLWENATAALDRLRAEYDLVIIEGAGSAAELNLKRGDIVNMAIAQYANAPVLLVGDIDRGGIFAQLLGTHWLLEPAERALVCGFIVNKFRGDITLFQDGVQIIEDKAGIPVLGVIPYLRDLSLPDEDAVSIENGTRINADASRADIDLDNPRSSASFAISVPTIDIVILKLPRIANFDDFDPLRNEAGVCVRYVASVAEFGNPDAVIISGTKSTIADLEWLRQNGLADAIIQFAKQGGAIVGICGGYQMLGQWIADPHRVESKEERVSGLGLLPVTTEFSKEKNTYQTQARINCERGWLSRLHGAMVNGYEIHNGETIVILSEAKNLYDNPRDPSLALRVTGENSFLRLARNNASDGYISPGGKLWGCYLHGIFNNDDFRHAWLESLGWKNHPRVKSQAQALEETLTALADAVESALDMEALDEIVFGLRLQV